MDETTKTEVPCNTKVKGQHGYDVSMIMTYLLVVVVGIGVVVGGGTFTAKII